MKRQLQRWWGWWQEEIPRKGGLVNRATEAARAASQEVEARLKMKKLQPLPRRHPVSDAAEAGPS